MNRSLMIIGLVISVMMGGLPLAIAQERSGTLVPPSRHESNSHVTPDGVRSAIANMNLLPEHVVSTSFGTSSHAGFDVFNTPATLFPTDGSSYLVMSTGSTSSALNANSEDDLSTELGGLNTAQGEDLVQIVLVLKPPPGASCLAFDFAFYSEEFPEYVGSQYNDAFIAEIGQSNFQEINQQIIAPNNFAFDTQNNVVSVNTVFGVTAGAADGTTYDGGTPLLTATTPVTEIDNNGNITITLSIMDLGDSIYDSTVFIDNFRWFFGLDCEPGADADTDGDSLLDDWEVNGIDFDKDGVVDLDLPAMGADPTHKDIFVEIDYMVLAGTTGHSHRPKMDALQIVIDAFNNAPVPNPDGTTGIHIHIDAGSDTIMNPVTMETWGTMSESDELAHVNNLGGVSGGFYDWTAFDGIKGVGVPGSFSIQRGDVFHYCIFAHNLATAFGTTSGIARGIPSSDFIVSLGGWTGQVGTVNEQGGTLMHELGHGLGLFHGGDDPSGNREPNYLSLMSYSFQTRGLRVDNVDGTFDYSRFSLPALNEGTLDETAGIAAGPLPDALGTYGTRYFDASGIQRITNDISMGIDWNGDGDATDNPVSVDINASGAISVILGSDNWDELVFNGGAVGHLGENIVLPQTSESIDIDEPTDGEIPTEYKVHIMGPGDVLLEVCETTTYLYTVMNTGVLDDTYQVSVSQTQSWADVSGVPSAIVLASGESMDIMVPVSIPDGAPTGAIDELMIGVVSDGNPLMMDVAETKSEIGVPTDSDGDGLPDFCDACPNSDLNPTIQIGGCDSGVANVLFADGCTMADLIAAGIAGSRNHGGFVSFVTQLANSWKKDGLISGAEKGAITKCAAKSPLP